MAESHDVQSRVMLPIPDRPAPCLTTYDAKDPDTAYPPIEPLLPPGRVEATQPMIFSADETTDIGYESGSMVTPDYTARTSKFTGKIRWVQLDVGDDDHDHFIDPDERLRIAMAQQ